MHRIALGASWILVVSGLAAQAPAVHLPIDFGRLTNDSAREAWRGVIAPDGRRYLYEVVYGHDRQLWLLDLSTRQTRRLTFGSPMERREPAWSPDGRSIAFISGDEIRVVPTADTTERVLFTRAAHPPLLGILSNLAWQSDTDLTFVDSRIPVPVTEARWHVTLSGSATRLDSSGVDSLPPWSRSVSPDGRWVAALGHCCGGGQAALWLRNVADGTKRCVAGPFRWYVQAVWLPEAQGLLLIVDDPRFGGEEAFAVPMAGGPARRLVGLPAANKSASVAREGTVAIVTAAPGDSVGHLWLTRVPPVTDPRDTLGRCPDPQPSIAQFVRAAQLPDVRSVTEFETVPAAHFALFTVVYGPMEDWDLYPSKSGVVYRDHGGWLSRPGDTATTAFHIPPGDRLLFSEKLDRALGASAKGWRAWLAMQPEIPRDAIIRLATADGGATLSALANNPSVHTADLPVSALAKLGARGPQYARFVITATRLGNDADAVADLARLPAYRFDPSVQGAAQTRLRALAPAVLANRKARESTVFEIVGGNIGYGWALDFSRHPAARRSTRILTVLGAAEWPQGPADQARQMLAARGVTLEDGVLGLIEAAEADSLPPDVLDRLESVSAPVQRSNSLQRAMSLMGGRYAPLRLRARQALAHSAATPDSVLLPLARTIDRQHEGVLLYELMHNRHAVTNPDVVAALRAQGIAVP